MLRVLIKSTEVQTHSGIAKATNKPFSMRFQRGYAYLVGPDGRVDEMPDKCDIQLGDKQEPYAPGDYQISPASFVVGSFKRLSLGRLQLVPLGKPQSAQKAA